MGNFQPASTAGTNAGPVVQGWKKFEAVMAVRRGPNSIKLDGRWGSLVDVVDGGLLPGPLAGCYTECPGQVAQSVERSPEKAGVGGSIPSLATTCIRHSRLRYCDFTHSVAGSEA